MPNNFACKEHYSLPDDFFRQAVPFFFWKRFEMFPVSGGGPGKNGIRYDINFPLDYGYAFLVRELLYRQQGDFSGTVKMQFYSKARGREYQLHAFYPRLISSPGTTVENAVLSPLYVPAPLPKDADALNRGVYAVGSGPKSRVPLNLFYHYRENVFVSFFLSPELYSLYAPAFADFLLVGYKVPERKLSMWR